MSYSFATARRSRRTQLIEQIRESVIGDDAVLPGPFGPRRMVYADATASGRSLGFRRREHDFARRALRSWGANPNIEILGSTDLERLAIVSFGLRHGGGHLHANFVVSVLSEGWKLLPLYSFDPVTGLWHHRSGAHEELPSFRDVLAGGRGRPPSAPETVLPGQLQAARRIIVGVQERPPRGPLDDPEISEEFERIRWFPLPNEGLERLHGTTRIGGSHGT